MCNNKQTIERFREAYPQLEYYDDRHIRKVLNNDKVVRRELARKLRAGCEILKENLCCYSCEKYENKTCKCICWFITKSKIPYEKCWGKLLK